MTEKDVKHQKDDFDQWTLCKALKLFLAGLVYISVTLSFLHFFRMAFGGLGPSAETIAPTIKKTSVSKISVLYSHKALHFFVTLVLVILAISFRYLDPARFFLLYLERCYRKAKWRHSSIYFQFFWVLMFLRFLRPITRYLRFCYFSSSLVEVF